jgi:hypothetical protein
LNGVEKLNHFETPSKGLVERMRVSGFSPRDHVNQIAGLVSQAESQFPGTLGKFAAIDANMYSSATRASSLSLVLIWVVR